MSDTMTTIIGILIAVILLFIFPIMAIADRSDDVAQQAALTAVSDFAYTVSSEGAITEESYSKCLESLAATAHTYDVEIEVKHIDENIGNKSAWTSSSVIGENAYYSVYTSQILEKLNDVGKYTLKEGDYVSVIAKNTDITLSQSLKNMFYQVLGKGTSTIAAQVTEQVTSNGN